MQKIIPASKKILMVCAVVIFIFTLLFIFPGSIYGTPGILEVGAGKTYTTIQSAINAAAAGDTIVVAAGTYNEAVVINKANLIIQSETKFGAIIRPLTTPANSGAALYINANGATIDGFEIDGTTVCNNGIYGWDTSNLTIKNNKVHGAINAWDGCGILLMSWGTSGTVHDNLIKDNEVYDTGRMGIMVMDHGANYTATYNNTITGNTVYDVWKKATDWSDGGGGIQINVGKNCSITNNLVYNVQDGQRGIYMFGSCDGNVISSNTLRDNPVGIQLWISGEGGTTIDWGGEIPKSPQVHNNSIYNNAFGARSTNILGTAMVMDAINNWWGDNSGPGGGVADPVTGTIASGNGNPISENVNFDPWSKNEGTAKKQLTPEEIASLNLSIAQQVAIYGASDIGFTKMLYDNILGRASDSEGLNDWVTALNEGKVTLGSIVYNFVFSEELKPTISAASPEEFITFLYKNVLGRNPDPDGYNNWISLMQNGMSKEDILLHFIDSDEFKDICEMFGLEP